ncbi:hypothetical protein BUALT_Bualt05G0093300 [Buddleja alternifolia]|uniref:Uncharacterized protein n=1 Tax=Buddleja alternifolia TaxID=168488 RepID=A0AAV6XHZ8_9LAMI|nr:hypothetical protein BUALT_Bualt05G0093300 [Buddleja alternifolia]
MEMVQGNYNLCDSGYTNGDGFMAPYRRVRWHRIIMAIVDPIEAEVPEINETNDDPEINFIDQVEPSQQWRDRRDD